MKEIEDYLPKVKIQKLHDKLENEWANLDQEKIILTEQLEQKDYDEKNLKSLVKKVK